MNFFKKKSNQKGNQRKFKKKNPAHWYKYFITAAVILITVLYLKPLVSSGWIADDASHSLSWYQAKMTNMSLSDRLTSYFITGGKVPGRFFPFAGYAFLLFTIAPNIVLYKSIVLCIIVVSIFLFYHLVKRLSGNEHTALLACLIMPAFFQFRFFYDPILYGSAIMPIIFSLTFLSLIFLDKFLETYKWKFYILSFTIYIISLLTYEITYVFFLLHFSLIYFRRKNLQDVFRYGAVFLGALGIAVIGSINERLKFGAQTVATYNVHFVPKVYFLTVLKQLYAALPLSYSLSNPSQILPQTFGYRLSHIQLLDLVIVVLFLICYFF